MTAVLTSTFAVKNDEPCALLVEVNLPAPDSKSVRRYQLITVVRNDKLAECRVDLGPRENFTAPQFRILGGWETHIDHTVGELRDIAEWQRNGGSPMPERKPTDLVGEWHDMTERRRKARTNKSLFGPHGHHQRG